MALTVVVRSGELGAPAAITFDAPRVVIGRGDGCEVRLPDPSVSHRHASIRQRGTDYVVLDEGSTNGTFVGPVRLSPHAPRVVRSGDLLRVGRVWLELRIEQVPATQNAHASTRELALSLVKAALDAQGEPASARVSVQSGPDQSRELFVSEFERVYVVGRGPEADLPLSDPDTSRRHIEVFRRAQHVYVRDLGSKNGTTLGGKPLASKEAPWIPGTSVTLGGTELALEDPLSTALHELENAVDEAMRDGDSIDPPPVQSDSNTAPDLEAPEPEEAPKPAAKARREADKPDGVRLGDVIIGLLSLVVLAASLLGLAWVLRSR
jgi:pSer/pThr/pTyr-binding forkhead associated (FHA) protein